MMTTYERAKVRVNYRLSFRQVEPRELHDKGMYGPELPNAYDDGATNGTGQWDDFDGPSMGDPHATEDAWIQHWLRCAIGEAVHEALEWFQVDGLIFLNPHGEHEAEIFELSAELADRLAALRYRPRPEGSS